jgi:probable rRNA maturation factor
VEPGEPRVQVDDETYPEAPVGLIEAAVVATLEDQGGEGVEVSVALLDDDEMQRLNSQFLGKDRTTDVLAFALEGGEGTTLGDVYLGYEQASRQAQDVGVSLEEELVRLAIHGTLHVLGHDHPEGPERVESPMFRLQEVLVSRVMAEVGGTP